MSGGPMLTGAIAKISTQTAGGWKVGLDVPESMGMVVKQLLGTENKKIYRITFEEVGEIEPAPKRAPGRPKEVQE